MGSGSQPVEPCRATGFRRPFPICHASFVFGSLWASSSGDGAGGLGREDGQEALLCLRRGLRVRGLVSRAGRGTATVAPRKEGCDDG